VIGGTFPNPRTSASAILSHLYSNLGFSVQMILCYEHSAVEIAGLTDGRAVPDAPLNQFSNSSLLHVREFFAQVFQMMTDDCHVLSLNIVSFGSEIITQQQFRFCGRTQPHD
jgi:hypothetical protein